MTLKTPRLVIGLGDSGMRVITQVLQHWRDSFSSDTPPVVIGVGFDAPPPDFPADSYVRLTRNVQASLDSLRQEPAPHLDSWLDVELWASRWRSYPTIPRALERLMWVDEIARGERSELYQLWLRKLRQARSDRAILTFLVADLAESAGSSLIADAAFFTHTLAQVEVNSKIKLWGYTILPLASAPLENKLRAFASLRELSRLTSTQDRVHGEPFHYRASTARHIDNRILRGSLTVKPFELWYCFDGNANATDSIAGVISNYLSTDAYDKAVNHLINVSARFMPPERVYIGATNASTVVLPINSFQKAWAAKLAVKIADDLLKPLSGDPAADTMQFWRKLPNTFEASLLKMRPSKNDHENWLHQFDSGLFSSATLFPQAYTPASMVLRSDSNFPDPSKLSLAVVCNLVFDLNQCVDRFKSGAEGYRKLLDLALTRRTGLFNEHLLQLINQRLQKFGLVYTANVLSLLRDQAQMMFTGFKSLIQHLFAKPANDDALLREYTLAVRNLEAICAENPKMLARWGQLDRARASLDKAQINAKNYLNRMRWRKLADVLEPLLTHYLETLDHLVVHFESWQQKVEKWRFDWDEIQRTLPVPFGGEWLVVNDPHGTWGQQQYDRLVTKTPPPSTGWQVTLDDLTLLVDDEMIQLQDDTAIINAKTDSVFAEARSTSTLLAYLQSEQTPPEDIARFLLQAEQMPLESVLSKETYQEPFGRLVAPEDLDPIRRKIVSQVEAEIKQAHNIALEDDAFIQRQIHDSPQQIVYTFTVERIDLLREVPSVDEMQHRYLQSGVEVAAYHALAGEINAIRIEHLLAQNGQPIKLAPNVVSALADPLAVYYFFAAYLLEVIDYKPQLDAHNSYRFGYRLLFPDREVWLSSPSSNTLPLLWDAIKTFSASKQVMMDGEIVSLGTPQHELYRMIDEHYAHALQKHLPQTPQDGADDQLRVWLERVHQRGTPPELREEVSHAAADCYLLMGLTTRLLEDDLPHRSNTVQHELYLVGAALLKERVTARRNQIAESISRLSRISRG